MPASKRTRPTPMGAAREVKATAASETNHVTIGNRSSWNDLPIVIVVAFINTHKTKWKEVKRFVTYFIENNNNE